MSDFLFKAKLDSLAAKINAALDKWLVADSAGSDAHIIEACRYSTLLGGKRIRAALTLLVGECYQRENEALLRFGCAIELIHAYSLIHDDLPAMDNDDFRRGKPSNHRVFGEATAILAGDNLLTLAFAWIAELKDLDVKAETVLQLIRLLAAASGSRGMIGGQMLDMAAEKRQISPAELEQIHRLKTGALIAAPVCGAAMLCDAPAEDLAILQSYSEKIGLLFQIVDDILDVEGSLESLGKAPGSDEKAGKATYPGLLGLEAAKKLAAQTHSQALSSLCGLSVEPTMLAQMADFIYSRKN